MAQGDVIAQTEAPPELVPIRWLRRVFNHTEGGWVTVFGVTEGQRATHWAQVDEVEQLSPAIDAIEPCGDLWFGVATRAARLNGRRGGDADCLTLPALWLDIDVAHDVHNSADLPASIAEARQLIEYFPLPPTAIVDSGHGLQVWWQFSEPVPAAEAKTLLARWAATWIGQSERCGWHLDNVFDLARIMRLPGTTNRKAEPVPVKLLEADWTRTYGVDDIDQYLTDPQPQPQLEGKKTPYIGPQRPGDAFNAARRGQDVLSAAGWVHGRTDANGDEHWVRPGKQVRQGTGATVYAEDGHTTIWSDATGLPVRRPLDPFGLHTYIHHGGDWRASSEALAAQGYGTSNRADDDLSWVAGVGEPGEEEGDKVDGFFIDWAAFWSKDRRDADWLFEDVLARGRGHALFAGHKVGKSLLMLWLAMQLIGGGTVVVYLDYEMGEDDLYDRLSDMGYGPETDLSLLRYALLPSLSPLDTLAGGEELLGLLDQVAAKHPDAHLAVVIDTTGRAVVGEENSADTIRAFYRWTGMRLKQRGVTWARLDHAGKDQAKGQRGSSAKGDDVDVVWRLVLIDDGVELRREAARMGWVPEKVAFKLTDGPLSYKRIEGAYPAGTAEVADHLRTLGVALDASTREASKALKQAGFGKRNEVVVAALRYRRQDPRSIQREVEF